MTNEQAIKWLKEALKTTDFQYEQMEKAVEMAIKALEQEPTDDATLRDIFCMGCEYKEQEPCDDVIDRAEAMTEIMMFAGNVKSDEEDVYIKVSDAVQLLRELPSVKPQEPTGHWIKDDITERSKVEYKHKCDRCGAYHRAMYDYCPSCGAKMESEDKE